MSSHADNAQERILDAAEQVVVELGAGNLTFDAVASKAGVSRGGILYHFCDKEALLKGMLDRLTQRRLERRRLKRGEMKESVDREMVAHVLSSLEEEDEKIKRARASALFAVGAHNPGLLLPYREEYEKLMDDLTRNGLRFERAAVIALAIDGLRLLELLSVSPFDKEKRLRIIAEMISLAKETGNHEETARQEGSKWR